MNTQLEDKDNHHTGIVLRTCLQMQSAELVHDQTHAGFRIFFRSFSHSFVRGLWSFIFWMSSCMRFKMLTYWALSVCMYESFPKNWMKYKRIATFLTKGTENISQNSTENGTSVFSFSWPFSTGFFDNQMDDFAWGANKIESSLITKRITNYSFEFAKN